MKTLEIQFGNISGAQNWHKINKRLKENDDDGKTKWLIRLMLDQIFKNQEN